MEEKTKPETETPLIMDPLYGTLTLNWRWMLGLGIVSLILGVIGLGMTFFLSLAGALVFGVLLAIGGVLQLVDSVKCAGWKSRLLHIGIGIIYLAVGVLTLLAPVEAAVALTLVLGVALIVTGILRGVMAVQHREMAGWGWVLAGGIASLLLGVLILLGWPVTGLWVIGLFIALELIISGISYIVLALGARRGGREAQA